VGRGVRHRILVPWTAKSLTIAGNEEGDQGEDIGPDPKSRSNARRAVPISSTI
jgi:hypothetical protein